MKNKFLVSAMSALILLTQTACMTNNGPASCSVQGGKYLSSGASDEQICSAFAKRLSQAMAVDGSNGEIDDLSIALALDKRGSVEARVTRQNGTAHETYPVTAVDVLDRPIGQRDLDSLADAVAQQLMKK